MLESAMFIAEDDPSPRSVAWTKLRRSSHEWPNRFSTGTVGRCSFRSAYMPSTFHQPRGLTLASAPTVPRLHPPTKMLFAPRWGNEM
jgi:hypothetical protein